MANTKLDSLNRFLALGLFVAISGAPAFSQDLAACVDLRTKLDTDTVALFQQELRSIAKNSGLTLRLVHENGACPGVRLIIRTRLAKDISALGAARLLNGRVLPEIEVYAASIAVTLPSRLPALLGPALARVAAHEIGHYLTQSSVHADGLMSDRIAGPRLMVRDNRSFRIPRNAEALQSAEMPADANFVP
jgi:hypothetical protein